VKDRRIEAEKSNISMLPGKLVFGRRQRIIITVLALLSLLLIAGCASQTNQLTSKIGEEFSIGVGQSASIEGEELRVKFVEVISDSRCPMGANCIWEGEATCLVDIIYNESVYRKTLTQPGMAGSPSQADFEDYTIVFNVEPYPSTDAEIRTTDYRLRLTVNKRPTLYGGLLVTFDVVGEEYSIFITGEAAIEQVFAVQRGESEATIPSGRLITGSVFYNEPWTWHIDPEDIHMAEVTIELCDGTPSQVEDNLDYWLETVERFCPWSAEIVEIQDLR
jgi:hypothetical protein